MVTRRAVNETPTSTLSRRDLAIKASDARRIRTVEIFHTLQFLLLSRIYFVHYINTLASQMLLLVNSLAVLIASMVRSFTNAGSARLYRVSRCDYIEIRVVERQIWPQIQGQMWLYVGL